MSSLSTTLDELKQRFVARAASDLARLRTLQSDPQQRQDLHLIAHRLAGSAGFFGYSNLGATASAVDTQLADNGTTDVLPALLTALEEVISDTSR